MPYPNNTVHEFLQQKLPTWNLDSESFFRIDRGTSTHWTTSHWTSSRHSRTSPGRHRSHATSTRTTSTTSTTTTWHTTLGILRVFFVVFWGGMVSEQAPWQLLSKIYFGESLSVGRWKWLTGNIVIIMFLLTLRNPALVKEASTFTFLTSFEEL